MHAADHAAAAAISSVLVTGLRLCGLRGSWLVVLLMMAADAAVAAAVEVVVLVVL